MIFRLILCQSDSRDYTRDQRLHRKFYSGQAAGVRQQTFDYKLLSEHCKVQGRVQHCQDRADREQAPHHQAGDQERHHPRAGSEQVPHQRITQLARREVLFHQADLLLKRYTVHSCFGYYSIL